MTTYKNWTNCKEREELTQAASREGCLPALIRRGVSRDCIVTRAICFTALCARQLAR